MTEKQIIQSSDLRSHAAAVRLLLHQGWHEVKIKSSFGANLQVVYITHLERGHHA